MQKRSSTPKGRDVNTNAFRIMQEATNPTPSQPPLTPEEQLKAAAATLGRRGGLKGGKARAESLSAKRRSEIAKKAAAKRWKQK